MRDDFLRDCEKAVRLGERLGADEVEIFASDGIAMDVIFENNALKMAKRSKDSRAGIRVFRKRSLGFSSVNRLDKGSLEKSVRTAISLSKNAPPDKLNQLPDPKPRRRVGGLFDDSVAELTEDAVFAIARKMLRAALAVDRRVSVDGGHFAASSGSKGIVNSLGVEDLEERTSISYDIGAHAVDGPVVSSMDYRFDASCNLKEDASEDLSKELGEAVVGALSTKKMSSGKGTVIFSPLASIEVLIAPIFYSVDAYNVQKGTSRFKGKIGKRVASKNLTITDDGTMKGGLSSSAFDREGVPHTPMRVISGGRLEGYLYYSYTANKEHIDSTGHAGGGPASIPALSPTNVIVKSGGTGLDDMVGEIGRGLLVQRFSGRVNAISGDFSGVAKGSKVISKGSLGPVVRETMISGNLFEMLEHLSRVSRETKKYGSSSIPWISAEGLSITGE